MLLLFLAMAYYAVGAVEVGCEYPADSYSNTAVSTVYVDNVAVAGSYIGQISS